MIIRESRRADHVVKPRANAVRTRGKRWWQRVYCIFNVLSLAVTPLEHRLGRWAYSASREPCLNCDCDRTFHNFIMASEDAAVQGNLRFLFGVPEGRGCEADVAWAPSGPWLEKFRHISGTSGSFCDTSGLGRRSLSEELSSFIRAESEPGTFSQECSCGDEGQHSGNCDELCIDVEGVKVFYSGR